MPEPNEQQTQAEDQAGDQQVDEQAQQQQAPQQQTRQQQQPSQQQTQNDGRHPQGYVPVSDVVKERRKSADTAAKLTEAEARVKTLEQKETKRGYLRESLKTLGQNFHIEDMAGLEELVEGMAYDEADPKKTQALITKQVELAKRPIRSGSSTPMFGAAAKDQNTPADVDDGKPARTTSEIGRRFQQKLGITTD